MNERLEMVHSCSVQTEWRYCGNVFFSPELHIYCINPPGFCSRKIERLDEEQICHTPVVAGG